MLVRARPGLPDCIVLSDPPITVRLRVMTRARRFTLRLEESGDRAVLTLPPRVSEAEARDFLERHSGWLAKALLRQPARVALEEGVALPVDGRPRRILRRAGTGRVPLLEESALILPERGRAGPMVAAWLRARAKARLIPAAHGYAARVGRKIGALSFRDTRSRWGSCSSACRISLSWRLAMAPPEIQEYVAAHEVAHLVEMNHSDRFWAVVERLMPDYRPRRAWLRREGRTLHTYCFGDGT